MLPKSSVRYDVWARKGRCSAEYTEYIFGRRLDNEQAIILMQCDKHYYYIGGGGRDSGQWAGVWEQDTENDQRGCASDV